MKNVDTFADINIKHLLDKAPEEPAPLWQYRDDLMKAAHSVKKWHEVLPKVSQFPMTYVGMLRNLPRNTQVLLQSGPPRGGKTWNALYGLAISWWDKLEYGGGDLKLRDIYITSAKDFLRAIDKYPILIYDEAEKDIDMRLYMSFLFRAFQIMLDSQAFLYRWIIIIHPSPRFSPEVFRHFTYAQIVEKWGRRPGHVTAYKVRYNYKAFLAGKKPLTVLKIDEYFSPLPPKPVIKDYFKLEPEAKKKIREWILEELEFREEKRRGKKKEEELTGPAAWRAALEELIREGL